PAEATTAACGTTSRMTKKPGVVYVGPAKSGLRRDAERPCHAGAFSQTKTPPRCHLRVRTPLTGAHSVVRNDAVPSGCPAQRDFPNGHADPVALGAAVP